MRELQMGVQLSLGIGGEPSNIPLPVKRNFVWGFRDEVGHGEVIYDMMSQLPFASYVY